MGARDAVRIGNCSGFLGDRLSAAAELVGSGEVDVLTGDWLAELTMLILARQRMRGGPGYARPFLAQMEQVLGECVERGIPVVSNAGGLDPVGCGRALTEVAARIGVPARIAVVHGDDVLDMVATQPERFNNLATGQELGDRTVVTANAYLGGRPVTAALAAGADVVIAGRVTDAALVVGPAAWWHGWSYEDAAAGRREAVDRLAGAVVAGHVIECGAQATGGNYAFFDEVPAWPAGYPIAEVAADGSSVITKPAGSGGLVSVGTVTAQLVYEIGAPDYPSPDVTARFDTIRLAQAGPDRVAISGVHGARAPERLKVAATVLAGYRNTMSLVLTGRDARAKADLALRLVTGLGVDEVLDDAGSPVRDPGELARASRLAVAQLHVALDDTAADDPASTAAAQGHLRITVKDPQERAVGTPFTRAVVEAALASYPGMFPTAPPGPGSAYGIFWPTLIDRAEVAVEVHVAGVPVPLPADQVPQEPEPAGRAAGSAGAGHGDAGPAPGSAWAPEPGTVLGDVVGARSGDKGGDANVGIWIPEPGAGPSADLDPGAARARYDWLVSWLDADRVRALLPEAARLPVEVHHLPNLLAVNVVIHGLLGHGVSDSTSLDPQAKGLAEHLRARIIR